MFWPASGEMSWPASSQTRPRRRRKHRTASRRHQAWAAEVEEAEEAEEQEAWEQPPSPRRSRWEGPEPADWAPEEPPVEDEGGPLASWDSQPPPPPPSWGERPRSRSPGAAWNRPDARKAWGSPPSEGGGSFEEPRRPRVPRPGGGRWSSSERTGGGGRRRLPSPEAPSRQRDPDGEDGAWDRPRDAERPAWEPRQGSPRGPAGRWASAGRRGEESQSPSRERRSLGSSGRDGRQDSRGTVSGWNPPSREQVVGSSDGTGGRWGRTERRGREHHSPTRKQSGRASPQREARQERPGSIRYHARDPVNPEEVESRRRERNYLNRGREEGSFGSLKGERQSPNGEAKGQGSFLRFGGSENMDGGGRADWNSHQWGGQEKRTDAAWSAPLTGPISSSSAVPREWTPCESVVQWWMQCRSTLQKRTREQLMSICPRPTLPDRSSETPQVNPHILSLLNKKQEKELRSATHFNLFLQDEVLDLLAPAMTIYEMAEEAMEKNEPVDPMELREWSRRLLRFIGSINNRLLFQYRSQVLSTINPRLRMVASKMSGQSTEGMLFAEDKVKLLKEIIMRFPQLTETRREMPRKKFYSFTGAASYKQTQSRPFLGSRFKPVGTGEEGTADQRAEQSHSQGAREQGPAEWH